VIASRIIRMMIFTSVLTKYNKFGKTDVDRQMSQVYILGLHISYISSGIFTLIENR